MIIAIDGPAASGKSTTAKLIAREFGLLYLDTGAMYRAVALYVKEHDIDLNDFLSSESMLSDIEIEFKVFDQENHIFLNGKDVSENIRTPEISKMSSDVATIRIIREKMVEIQRKLSSEKNVILDGRDIGTVVFPDADFKFFLTASVEKRALRRYLELTEKGLEVNIEDIKKDLLWRDMNDIGREVAPLKKAEDAIEIDNSEMSINEQVEYISKMIRERFA